MQMHGHPFYDVEMELHSSFPLHKHFNLRWVAVGEK